MPKRKKKQVRQPRHDKESIISRVLIICGGLLISAGILMFLSIYAPVAVQEISYRTRSKTSKIAVIHPVDNAFAIVIPKIGANSKVISNVSPYNEKDYQVALTKGVAHARDTSLPGEPGNSFYFAHSAANWYQASRYNAIFYLLTKLEPGDDIYVFYKGEKYRYQVTGHEYVDPADLTYLHQLRSKKTLSLMTCWPPGTTLKRLVVNAELTP